MKTLTKQTEQQLLAAIEKASEYVDTGLHPNDAITKAAAEDNIKAGHVQLMVHAYNTGRTAAQRENGRDPLEKAATFELADTATVLDRLYPDQVKTAAEQHRSQAISPEYSRPPTWLKEQARTKLAHATLPPMVDRRTGEPAKLDYEPYPRDAKEQMKRAHCQVQRQQHAVEEARRVKSAAHDRLRAAYGDFVECFRRPGTIAFGTVKQAAVDYFGPNGQVVVDTAAKTHPQLTKQAAAGDYPDMASEPITKLARVIEATQDYQQKERAWQQLREQSEKQAVETLRPFAGRREVSVLGEPQTPLVKESVGGGMMAALSAANLLSDAADTVPKDGDRHKIEDYVAEATDPSHEEELRQIRSSAMLNELLSNDEVIGGYQPDDVLQAYNDIVALSPRAADNKLLMQSMLRQLLTQGSLAQSELDSTLGLEDKLKKRDEGASVGVSDDPAQVLAAQARPSGSVLGKATARTGAALEGYSAMKNRALEQQNARREQRLAPKKHKLERLEVDRKLQQLQKPESEPESPSTGNQATASPTQRQNTDSDQVHRNLQSIMNIEP